MELGKKLRQARISAGLSQRTLCGDVITRNMLSQIENGSAQPSMSTLRYLSGQLKLPMSYFLDEDVPASSNASRMKLAWDAFETGNAQEALDKLNACSMPDPVYEREHALLMHLVKLLLAEQSIEQGRVVYARQLLAQTREFENMHPYLPELKTRRILLLSRTEQAVPLELCPDIDAVLLLRAKAALTENNPDQAIRLLEAAQDRTNDQWLLLRGRGAYMLRAYLEAVYFLKMVEKTYPEQVYPMLEACYRELNDYKSAYEYACMARNLPG